MTILISYAIKYIVPHRPFASKTINLYRSELYEKTSGLENKQTRVRCGSRWCASARLRKKKEKGLVAAQENKGAPPDGEDDRRELMGDVLAESENGLPWMEEERPRESMGRIGAGEVKKACHGWTKSGLGNRWGRIGAEEEQEHAWPWLAMDGGRTA